MEASGSGAGVAAGAAHRQGGDVEKGKKNLGGRDLDKRMMLVNHMFASSVVLNRLTVQNRYGSIFVCI